MSFITSNNTFTVSEMDSKSIRAVGSQKSLRPAGSQKSLRGVGSQNNLRPVRSQNSLHHVKSNQSLHHVKSNNSLHHVKSNNSLHHVKSQSSLHHVKSQGNLRQALAASIAGQPVHVPDLHALFDGWDQGTNKHVERLRTDVDIHLKSLFSPGKRLSSLLAADAGSFAAQWWPDAEYEELKIAAWLSIWLFAWDDETDSHEFSSIVDSQERAQKMRAETLMWCKYTLGLGGDNVKVPTSPFLRSFDEVGSVVRQHYDEEQRLRLFAQIDFFVQMSGVEQKVQLSGKLPTVDEYRQRRMGTSAVTVCLAITEYSYQMSLPHHLITASAMGHLWDATNVIISTVNDMLSIRKEVANGQVDSLVPLLTFELGTVQKAMDAATKQLEYAIAQFEEAANDLVLVNANDGAFDKLQLMIRGCRTACTANLNWSLSSQRYRLDVPSLAGGVTIII